MADEKFPFFGQGSAGYYEWFEMWIWFQAPVPKKAQKALLEGAPTLCAEDASWPHPELLWASTGDQFIHMHIIDAYADLDEDFNPEEEGPDNEATGPMLEGFEKHIERWVREMHAKHPILFAARGEDGEGGGTELGAWHEESVKMAPAILPVLEKAAVGLKDKDTRAHALRCAIAYLDPAILPPTLLAMQQADADEDGDEDDEDDEDEDEDE